jgi:antitoxin VapB
MKAKLFKNGHSQAVRLPKEFRFKGREVNIERVGDTLVITQVREDWASFFALPRASKDFMAERDQPPVQERETI